MMKRHPYGILVLLFFTSCLSQNKEYLTESERKWNTYQVNQRLVFETHDRFDTLLIEEISSKFPDGLGVSTYNERLRVLVKHRDPKDGKWTSTYGFSVISRRPEEESKVDFSLSTQNARFYDSEFRMSELSALPEMQLTVPYGAFEDVIVIHSKLDHSAIPTAIELIYWSKSKGYLKFDKYDGTSWELVEIIEP